MDHKSRTPSHSRAKPRRRQPWMFGLIAAACLTALAMIASVAFAAQPPVGLGTDGSFAILAGQAVTNTGPSVIGGDLGVSPGTAVTGFPPGVLNGTLHSADAVAAQAQSDLTTAYNDAAGRTPPVSVPADLVGLTLTAGVYKNSSALGLTGPLTLDAHGNPDAVFIFQAGSTLTTASGSTVNLINGAQPCNVFWQVGSSATLGTSSTFVGNIFALTSISVNNGVTVAGRLLARNGSVTLINDTVSAANCATGTTTTTGAGAGTTTPGSGGSSGTGASNGGGGSTTGANGHGGGATTLSTSLPKALTQSGKGACVKRTFKATITGKAIKSVVFVFGGRVVATRGKSPLTALVNPDRGSGTSALTARVDFTNGKPAKTLSLQVVACAAATRSVTPTAGAGGFTG
jgi:hypothetical protein